MDRSRTVTNGGEQEGEELTVPLRVDGDFGSAVAASSLTRSAATRDARP